MDLQQGAEAVKRLSIRIGTLRKPPEGLMQELLNYAKIRIQERTLSSTDWQGNPFAPYSEGYYYVGKENPYYDVARNAGGRTVHKRTGEEIDGVIFDEAGYKQFKEGLAVDAPNLRVLGEMLASIEYVIVSESLGVLSIEDSEMNARGAVHEYGGGKVPARPWWNIGYLQEEKDEMMSIIRRHYTNAINNALQDEENEAETVWQP